jgi:hypothetical protein
MRFTVQFECSERTCSPEYGKFCAFLNTRRFGTIYECALFNEEINPETLERCDKCKDNFKIEGGEQS